MPAISRRRFGCAMAALIAAGAAPATAQTRFNLGIGTDTYHGCRWTR